MPTPTPMSTATPPTAGRVLVRPLSAAADAHRLRVALTLDGANAQRQTVRGTLEIDSDVIASSRQRRLTISGEPFLLLFGDLLPLPAESLSAYFVDDQVFLWLPLFIPVCATFARPPAMLLQARDQLSADALLMLLTDGSGALPVVSSAEEEVEGAPARRYVLDVNALNARARVRGAAITLRSAEVWLAQPEGYPLRVRADLSGDLRAFGLDFVGNVQLDLIAYDINALAPIALPAECRTPMRL